MAGSDIPSGTVPAIAISAHNVLLHATTSDHQMQRAWVDTMLLHAPIERREVTVPQLKRRAILRLCIGAGLVAGTGLMGSEEASAQALPPPIELPIANRLQEAPSWCWVAVAQQVVTYYAWASPSQCAMVAAASNVPPQACCGAPQACNRPGNFADIQNLIAAFGGRYSQLSPPADPMSLYRVLQQRRPVVVFLQGTQRIGHFVLIRGMAWTPSGPVVAVNDPMSYFTQPVPYIQLMQFWRAAIVPF